jgi:flagellar hook-basal body complex protein FliE
MSVPIDPSFAVTGAEWRVDNGAATAQPSDGTGFSGALGDAVKSLANDQAGAAKAAEALATGTATDQTAAVMALEKARLSMQLASQIRTKAVEAIGDVMRTQV